MTTNDVEDPLLQQSVNSSNRSNENSVLTRRISVGASSASVHESYLTEQQTLETLRQAEYTPAKKIELKPVYVSLGVYLGVGAICFYFMSNQIKGNKTNGILDAIYFCVVTMTTVGYGDLVPETKLAKFMACIFVFTGMALVGFILSNAADYLLEKQEILFVKAIHKKKKKTDSSDNQQQLEFNKLKYKVLTALGFILVLILIGMLFLYNVEDLDLFDSFYCVCSTITSLGYGDMSFQTKEGRLFAACWILISTVCWAQFFYYLAELYTERRQRSFVKWVLTRKFTAADLEAADLDDDNVVSASEYILYKLKEIGKISEKDISMVMKGFRAIDVDNSGTLTENDLVFSQKSESGK